MAAGDGSNRDRGGRLLAGFLALSGIATAEAGLSTLSTEARVLDWITALMDRRLTAHTIRFRATGLQRGCEVMYPFSDWRWLKEIVADLPDGRPESRRRKMHKVRHTASSWSWAFG